MTISDTLLHLGRGLDWTSSKTARVSGVDVEFVVRTLWASPTPTILTRDLSWADNNDLNLLYVVPKANNTLRSAAHSNQSISFVATDTAEAVIQMVHLDNLDTPQTSACSAPRGRVPWLKYAIMRMLAAAPAPLLQADFATSLDVSQSAVSQQLRRIQTLVRRTSAGWAVIDTESVWAAHTAHYPGHHHARTSWRSHAPVIAQSSHAMEAAREQGARALLGGDSAADLIAPWRTPVRATVYVDRSINLATAGFVRTTSDRSTLDLVLPADRFIFATADATGASLLDCVDPVVAAWDVQVTGGPDAEEAIEQLRTTELAASSRRTQ